MRKLLMAGLLAAPLIGSSTDAIGFVHKAPAGRKTIMVEMQEFRFIPNQIVVERGRITFEVRNRGEIPHVFQVTGPGVDTHIGLLPGGATSLALVFITPGTYTLICPIPMHPEQGMQGSVMVR